MSTTDYAHVSTGELIQKFPSARVNLPVITMPERSYMRSSLTETADAIRAGLSEAVAEWRRGYGGLVGHNSGMSKQIALYGFERS